MKNYLTYIHEYNASNVVSWSARSLLFNKLHFFCYSNSNKIFLLNLCQWLCIWVTSVLPFSFNRPSYSHFPFYPLTNDFFFVFCIPSYTFYMCAFLFHPLQPLQYIQLLCTIFHICFSWRHSAQIYVPKPWNDFAFRSNGYRVVRKCFTFIWIFFFGCQSDLSQKWTK